MIIREVRNPTVLDYQEDRQCMNPKVFIRGDRQGRNLTFLVYQGRAGTGQFLSGIQAGQAAVYTVLKQKYLSFRA